MSAIRVIPCLLWKSGGLIKTIRFKDEKYVGDAMNTIRIFNEKEVDELIFLDVAATVEEREPDLDLIRDVAGECFMPFCYGGGIRKIQTMEHIFHQGAEKIMLNAAAVDNASLVKEAVRAFGSQSVVVAMDIGRQPSGEMSVFTHRGTRDRSLVPQDHAMCMQDAGAGELLVNSIERDGTGEGYDVDQIRRIAACVQIPVIACAGAGSLEHLKAAVDAGASAVAAGSFFVFHGKRRAVLITYPEAGELDALFPEDDDPGCSRE